MAKFINNEEYSLKYIFKDKISITGKHSTYLRKLTKYTSFSNDPVKEDKALKVFEKNINTYIVATIIGLKFNKKSPIDNSSTELPTNIVTETILNDKNAETLEYLYHMVILLDDITLTEKERIERAFSTDENVIKQNKEIFNSYFRGGLELLYNGAPGLHEGFKNINTITNKGEPNLEDEMSLIGEIWKLISGFNCEVNSYNDNISAEEVDANMNL